MLYVNIISTVFKNGERLVIYFPGEDGYYIGSVVSEKGKEVKIRFDDGDELNFSTTSPLIVGKGIKKENESLITERQVNKWIKRVIVKKVDIERLEKNPEKYVKKLSIPKIVKIKQKADDAYYNTGEPILSDPVYDELVDELKRRDPSHSELKKVGAPVKRTMGKTELPFYMPSLGKMKPDDDSIEKWTKDHKGPYIVMDKMDGISLGMVGTKDGWRIYTRGDGFYGQDVSPIGPYIKSLPKAKPGVMVRVEAEMKESTFKKLKSDTPNARNFVSGLINRKDIDVSNLENIDIVAYELVEPSMKPSEQMDKLKQMGFKVVPHKVVDRIDSERLSKMLEKRKGKSSFAIDGLVVMQDKKYTRTKEATPDYAKAFKMTTSDQIVTVEVKDVLWEPSKHGYLKPRIEIEPVELGGVNVTHATAFNAHFVKYGHKMSETDKPTRPIGPGAVIRIYRSGDVIPHIHEVVEGAKKPKMPDEDFVWIDSGIDIKLANEKESDLVNVKKLTEFVRIIGAENVKKKTIEKLYNEGFDTIEDLVELEEDDIKGISGIGDKSAKTIINEIHNNLQNIELPKLMHASGKFNRDLGVERLSLIVDNIPNILKRKADKDLVTELTEIEGISTKLASSFVEGLPEFKKFYKWIKDYAKITMPKKVEKVSRKLIKHNIAFTGFRDKELEEKIKQHGGDIASGVSSKATILLVKDKSKSTSKTQKAENLGIPIMTKEEFLKKYNID